MSKATISRVHFDYASPCSYTPRRIGCYVGAGTSPAEAAGDVLEQLAVDGFTVDENEILKECPSDDYDNEPDDGIFGRYWYCAILIQDSE